jgi:hypothetical protein
MQCSDFSSKKSEVGDKLAHFLAGIIIRRMRRTAVWLNGRFNQFTRKTQLRCLWAFVTLISILIGYTSLNFTSLTTAKDAAGYRPTAIGKPSPEVPTLSMSQ